MAYQRQRRYAVVAETNQSASHQALCVHHNIIMRGITHHHRSM
jgi:hypothetical protein